MYNVKGLGQFKPHSIYHAPNQMYYYQGDDWYGLTPEQVSCGIGIATWAILSGIAGLLIGGFAGAAIMGEAWRREEAR